MVSQVLSLLVTAFRSVADWFIDLVDVTSAAPVIVSVIAFMIFSRMIILPLLGGNFSGSGIGLYDRIRSSDRRKKGW